MVRGPPGGGNANVNANPSLIGIYVFRVGFYGYLRMEDLRQAPTLAPKK